MRHRVLYIILLLMPFLSLSGQTPGLDEIRIDYLEGWEGECGAEKLFRQLESLKLDNDPVLLAYRGAARSTLANCKDNPFKKLSFFNSGKKEIENAIEQVPENMEIRFIRFTIQDNIPALLNYDNMEEDKALILDQLSLQKQDNYPREFLNQIVDYLSNSDELNETEKNSLRLMLTKN